MTDSPPERQRTGCPVPGGHPWAGSRDFVFPFFMNIVIRPAAVQDSGVIVRSLILAMGEKTAKVYCGPDYREVLDEIVRMECSQYSYRNALVAVADGIPAGAVVGYDGGLLQPLRDPTLAVIRRYNPGLSVVDDETEAGEFYIDSIGVSPGFRGRGIGSQLLCAMRDRAFASGHPCVGLLVDCENPEAERLYLSLGFEPVGTKMFFGHPMRHLQSKYPGEPRV